ncbi:thioredoxin family protein [Janthinobacterium sp. 17J80-10]|uniref:thioredoxin family protein n=1 Tax=Janthinobacterium sp. 17J80-10 TaxID=2497863 RepID=UPI0010052B72|nr:thioredoxin family protein [Janthinobacterium sp. 17J80-10]QAU34393.1 thioredoxin [Janthinobacterium sp. 17J80-10]
MTALNLEPDSRAAIIDQLQGEAWVVACLCAAWCDVCKAYRPAFDDLAGQHPDKRFLWIDVEDQADLVGDFDIENFPTLLLQRGEQVAFFGAVQPDIGIARRLISAYAERSAAELRAEAASNVERQTWQEECNLRQRLLENS